MRFEIHVGAEEEDPMTTLPDEEPDGVWIDCENCGESGYDGHDCGEDCCVCASPSPNVRCDICHGAGGWEERA